MSDKNEIIRSAAAQVAENYRKSDILMYGDALRLPSRTAVIEIIRDFQKILFPAYYGDRDLLKLPPEQYSALLMGHVYDKLLRQLELVMPEGEEGARRAEKVCEAMMERLPHIQELLLKDLTANYNGDPAASSRQEIILSYPGMFAIFIYRIAHELYLEKVPMIPRIMTEYAHSQTGIDINPGATIGEYFSIDHGTGVVVGETTVIGDRVQLYLPMRLSLRRWALNKNSVSVDYGPLTMSLLIKERRQQADSRQTAIGDSHWQEGADASQWPTTEIYAASPWNYALVPCVKGMRVERTAWPQDNYPLALESVPLRVKASGALVPSWGQDETGLCQVLPDACQPRGEVEQLTLIPMGAARLRISAFPPCEGNTACGQCGSSCGTAPMMER